MMDTRCECCGLPSEDIVSYGEADSHGHTWTHHVCVQCSRQCSSDEEGTPVHMKPGWPKTPETFKEYRASVEPPCEHEWHYYGSVNGEPDYGCQLCGATRRDA